MPNFYVSFDNAGEPDMVSEQSVRDGKAYAGLDSSGPFAFVNAAGEDAAIEAAHKLVLEQVIGEPQESAA